MTVTTMKIQTDVRERLSRVATEDFSGATLSDTVARLLAEHEESRLLSSISAAYARLRADPGEWASYSAELDEWDAVVADGSGDRG
jgi:hypothetical protein